MEAKGIVRHDPLIEPFVTVKMNDKTTSKQSTGYKVNVQWWEKTFCM